MNLEQDWRMTFIGRGQGHLAEDITKSNILMKGQGHRRMTLKVDIIIKDAMVTMAAQEQDYDLDTERFSHDHGFYDESGSGQEDGENCDYYGDYEEEDGYYHHPYLPRETGQSGMFQNHPKHHRDNYGSPIRGGRV